MSTETPGRRPQGDNAPEAVQAATAAASAQLPVTDGEKKKLPSDTTTDNWHPDGGTTTDNWHPDGGTTEAKP